METIFNFTLCRLISLQIKEKDLSEFLAPRSIESTNLLFKIN
jgi:hypothetical protein